MRQEGDPHHQAKLLDQHDARFDLDLRIQILKLQTDQNAQHNQDDSDQAAIVQQENGGIDVQRQEFKRLGVVGDWPHPYATMNFRAEADIFRELGKFLLSGELYRGKKSVMWSVVEKTALADAEVEYYDHTSPTIYVRFPLTHPSRPYLEGASVVIWTTTPWTIPANLAVADARHVRPPSSLNAASKGSLIQASVRAGLSSG